VLDEPSVAHRLGVVGRQHALSYSWPRVTAQVLDLYHSVLEPVAVVA
jgi:hypothetical protein